MSGPPNSTPNPWTGDLISTTSILPCQFFAPSRPDAPERRLLLAIFESAVLDATATATTDHTVRALRWLASDAMEPFAAAWIADYLALDLGAVRSVVFRASRPIRVGHRAGGQGQPRRVNSRPLRRGGHPRSRWSISNLS